MQRADVLLTLTINIYLPTSVDDRAKAASCNTANDDRSTRRGSSRTSASPTAGRISLVPLNVDQGEHVDGTKPGWLYDSARRAERYIWLTIFMPAFLDTPLAQVCSNNICCYLEVRRAPGENMSTFQSCYVNAAAFKRRQPYSSEVFGPVSATLVPKATSNISNALSTVRRPQTNKILFYIPA